MRQKSLSFNGFAFNGVSVYSDFFKFNTVWFFDSARFETLLKKTTQFAKFPPHYVIAVIDITISY
jgi:hypothetical protein